MLISSKMSLFFLSFLLWSFPHLSVSLLKQSNSKNKQTTKKPRIMALCFSLRAFPCMIFCAFLLFYMCFSICMFPSCWHPERLSQSCYDYFSLMPTSKNRNTILGKNVFFLSFSSCDEGAMYFKRTAPLLAFTPHLLTV